MGKTTKVVSNNFPHACLFTRRSKMGLLYKLLNVPSILSPFNAENTKYHSPHISCSDQHLWLRLFCFKPTQEKLTISAFRFLRALRSTSTCSPTILCCLLGIMCSNGQLTVSLVWKPTSLFHTRGLDAAPV